MANVWPLVRIRLLVVEISASVWLEAEVPSLRRVTFALAALPTLRA